MHAQPQLIHARLEKLRPTQIIVAMREVAIKRKLWGAMGRKARIAVLSSHWFPAVAGPGERDYSVDHHHFGLTLPEDVTMVSLMLLKNLSWLELPKFWNVINRIGRV